MTALDVGCGPGALTAALVTVLGAGNVAAVDPSEPFVAACRARAPGADVRVGSAGRRDELRTACFRGLGSPALPFSLSARAWFVRGRA